MSDEPDNHSVIPPVRWKLYTDGASNDRCSGAGVVLVTPENRSICYALKLNFSATNNEAEYEAQIAGLKLIGELGVKSVEIFCDSQLVVYQVRGDYQARGQKLAPYLVLVQELLSNLERYDISHVPREQNKEADLLAKFASTGDAQQMGLFPVEALHAPSIDAMKVDSVLETRIESESWITPFKLYLTTGVLPEKRSERR